VAVVWLVLAVVLAVVEGFTLTFVLLMLAAGALAAGGSAALGAPLWAQILIFAGVSGAAMIAVRPALRKHFQNRSDQGIGMSAIEGSEALVIEDIDADRGQIKIDGEIWNARPYDAEQSFTKGTRVRVIEIKGATALVWRD
jgi:membrane protein implicated in regulation of membrane protease activity